MQLYWLVQSYNHKAIILLHFIWVFSTNMTLFSIIKLAINVQMISNQLACFTTVFILNSLRHVFIGQSGHKILVIVWFTKISVYPCPKWFLEARWMFLLGYLRSSCPLLPLYIVSNSLKLECDKLASEKSEMQRHYIMVSLLFMI